MNTQARGYRILLSAKGVGAITWLFVLFGPLIGGVVTIIWMLGSAVIYALLTRPQQVPTIGFVAYVVVVAVPYSYLLGALPAALAGITVGTAQIRFGQLSWATVLTIGAGVGVFYAIIYEKFLGALFGPPIKPEAPSTLGAFILCVTCIIPTLVCWRVVRNWYPKQLSPQ